MSRAKSEKDTGPLVLRGIGVSPGVVIGPAFLVTSELSAISEREILPGEIDREIIRFEEALITTRRQIKAIQKDLESSADLADASILDAHLMVLDDRMFLDEVISEVRIRRRNVESIVKSVAERYADVLGAMEDDYMRERVIDVNDVARRLIRNLTGAFGDSVAKFARKHVIVASDLAPSATASLRKDMVIGFVTDLGSPTSHTAVMARALEIPAIVGLRNVSEKAQNGDELLVDGNKGILLVNPTPAQLEEYGKVAKARRTIQRDLTTLKNQPAETKDGHRVLLCANLEGPEGVGAVKEAGAEGVGLFRSEYLYLSRDRIVSEEEQAEAYTQVAEALAPNPVIIRTLDLGGDKYLPAGDRVHEANPFLGCRSIRLSLFYPEQLRSQLRAILRATARGNVKIMYPMISGVAEVIRANEILEEAKADLTRKGTAFKADVEVGAMIEIPSAALTADAIAEHVRFFSIGTNDLVQYTIAVDRVNERVAYLYEPTHPAVLKLIKLTVEAGHKRGIWVGMCGEMAGDPLLAPLLIGLGVDELSMAPVSIPMVKDAIRKIEFSKAVELTEAALKRHAAVEVLTMCRETMREAAPELLELV